MNSEKPHHFDPFENRLSRTVRNGLGQALLAALSGGDLAVMLDKARTVVPADADPAVRRYVDSRIEKYRAVFTGIRSAGRQAADTWPIALLLWDQGLFFECHEWLEGTWHRSAGAEKKMLQSMIMAAGAYSHLEYGRTDAAGKLAVRAAAGLRHCRDDMPGLFDYQFLIGKLEALDPIPPKLGPD